MKAELKGPFSPKELAPFTVLKNGPNVVVLSLLYAVSFSAIYFFAELGSLSYFIFCFLVMGAIQHTLGTFVHEAAHFNLFTNKRMNDFVGHFFCAAPLISFLKDYRYFHFEHHRYTGRIDKDPELLLYRAIGAKSTYRSRTEVAKLFLQDVTGVSYMRSLKFLIAFFKEKKAKGIHKKPTPTDNLALFFWFGLIPLLMWTNGLLLAWFLFWLLPIFTITPILLRWHGFGEHVREKNSCISENTFTHKFSLIPTLFLYPINSSYHLEHHLYPQIPWYSLQTFHRWASQNPSYAEYSSKLTVDGFFLGEKTIVSTAFPIEK